MDPQFQELAREIADTVEKRLTGAFEERLATKIEERLAPKLEERLATTLEERLTTTLEERLATKLEDRLANKIEERLSGPFEQRIKTHIDEFEKRAELRMQMHFETLETNVTLAAEGYGATLQKIDRDLTELNKKFDTKFGDHDSVLRDHSQRITRLESQRS